MTQCTIKLLVDKRITENKLIENCLMYYHSGYDYKLLMAVYAMAKSWKIDKFTYYINLIENVN
jgi:hypothetical protein